MFRTAFFSWLTLLLVSGPWRSEAAEVTRAAVGKLGPNDPADVHLSLLWWREQTSSSVRREQAAGGVRAIDVPDLRFHQTRQILELTAAVGVYRGLGMFLRAPLVLGDERRLVFDRRGCGDGGPCVDENNSTFLGDGVLPGAGQAAYGLDVRHGRAFQRPEDLAFRGARRRGLESLGLGLGGLVLDERHTPTLPTWLLQVELRLSLTDEMRFDPAGVRSNQSVGLGYHELVTRTAFSRRLGAIQPYVGGWHMWPVVRGGSSYEQAQGRPQQRAGLQVGLEATAWENQRAHQRVAFEVRGRAEARFAGLARTALWEPLSGASSCASDPAICRPGIDVQASGTAAPHPGLLHSPAYGVYGGDVGLTMQVGPWVRFRALAGMALEQARLLGEGRPRRPVLDDPGRRFRVEDGRVWTVSADGGLTF